MADPLYWRLRYADGLTLDEPSGNASIRLAKAGAVRLVALRPDRVSVWGVDIPPGDKPVWYRIRSLALGTDGRPVPHSQRLDATVFGFARENADGGPDGHLWALIDGAIVACPPAYIQHNTIAEQIGLNAQLIGQ